MTDRRHREVRTITFWRQSSPGFLGKTIHPRRMEGGGRRGGNKNKAKQEKKERKKERRGRRSVASERQRFTFGTLKGVDHARKASFTIESSIPFNDNELARQSEASNRANIQFCCCCCYLLRISTVKRNRRRIIDSG